MTYPGIQCSPGKLLLVMAVCKTTASQLRICGSVRPLTVLSYTLLVITSVSVENGHQLPCVCVCVAQRALVEQMKSKAKEGTLKTVNGTAGSGGPPAKRRRWDVSSVGPADETPHKQQASKSSWDAVEANTPSQSRWDDTPGRAKGGETPGATPGASTRQWDHTPGHASSGAVTPGRETPGQQVTPSARRNRWDETPKTDRGLLLMAVLGLPCVRGCPQNWVIGYCVTLLTGFKSGGWLKVPPHFHHISTLTRKTFPLCNMKYVRYRHLSFKLVVWLFC